MNNQEKPPSKKLKRDIEQKPCSSSSSSSSALETIPIEQLENYNIFRFLQKKEDKEILKNARLAYVFGDTGLIMTTNDGVYSMGECVGDGAILTGIDQRGSLDGKRSIIPELCGLKVKGKYQKENCILLKLSNLIKFQNSQLHRERRYLSQRFHVIKQLFI
jgi:hypothetical protein